MRNYLWGSNNKLLTLMGVGLAALAISACSDDDPKDECTENKDCPGEQICNDSNKCVDPEVPECTKSSECDEGEICVDNKCSAASDTCGDGVVDADKGEECDDGDANSNTEPNACRTNCTNPECGDGVVDDGEECDDGPTGSEICSDTCELIKEVDFRWTSVAIQEPDVYVKLLDPDCEESALDSLLNDALADMVADPEDEGDAYALSINQSLSLPLSAGAVSEGEVTLPECTLEAEGKVCEAASADNTSSWEFRRSTATGTCFERIPVEANEKGWLDNVELELDDSILPQNDKGQCIVGESDAPFTIGLNLLDLADVDIELTGAYIAYELDDSNSTITKGVLAGFFTQEAADQDILGLLNVQDIFNSGSDESCFDTVPLDKGPDADGEIVDGWWLYLAFEGDDQVTVLE